MKNTWTSKYKINLSRYLNRRIRLLFFEDIVDSKINKPKNGKRNNGYAVNVVKKYLFERRNRANSLSQQKTLYLKLGFKGDVAGDILTFRLKRFIYRTFNASELHVISTKPIF